MRTVLRAIACLKWLGIGAFTMIVPVWAANVLIADGRWHLGHWIVHLYRGDLWISSGDPLISHQWGWEATRVRDGPEFWFGSAPRLQIGRPSEGTVRFFCGSPLWLLLLITVLPIAVSFWRRRWPMLGHCRTCGYDLTGNVSAVCPECGAKTHARYDGEGSP